MLAAAAKEALVQEKAQVSMRNISGGSSNSVAFAYGSASTAGAGAGADHALSVSAFISRFDEIARTRLQRMNEKLMQLEMQMQAMETEMNKACKFAGWD